MRIKVTGWMEMPDGEYADEDIYDWLCGELNKTHTATQYDPKFPCFSADNIMWVFEKTCSPAE